MQRMECLSASVFLPLVLVGGLSGCNPGDPNKGLNVKPTTRVTGIALVDGAAPDTPVQVKAYPVDGAEDQAPSFGGTAAEGAFNLSTYNTGDGLPPGDYKLTFVWTEMRLGGAALGGGQTDKLGGQYANPKTSPFTVTVEESKEVVDLGTFELKKSATPTKLADDRTTNVDLEAAKNPGGGGRKKKKKGD